MRSRVFQNLRKLSRHMRDVLRDKQFVLIFAYNGAGKTRLSSAFKDLGKRAIPRSDEITRDTLYYNSFTEDLFTWDNDIEGDATRRLLFNKNSHFFDGLRELEMDTRIRGFLDVHFDFDFVINYDDGYVSFSRSERAGAEQSDVVNATGDIKVSRGEENIFIWCFFLAIISPEKPGILLSFIMLRY